MSNPKCVKCGQMHWLSLEDGEEFECLHCEKVNIAGAVNRHDNILKRLEKKNDELKEFLEPDEWENKSDAD